MTSLKRAAVPPTRLVLLVDDDADVLRIVSRMFESRGWVVVTAGNGLEALEAYARERPDLVMLDLDLPGMPGDRVLTALRDRDPDATVIMLSGHGDIESAVDCMQRGAETFLTKPLVPAHFAASVEKAYEKAELRRHNRILADQQSADVTLQDLGNAPAMHEVAAQVSTFAAGNAPVLLTGETGVGKGWVARLLHGASPRRNAPFLSLNCAGLSATFLDSELFGHERGAFTDAKTQKKGLFEVANGGTMLLDEIGDLAPELQPKLLTVLETQRFRRLGGTREIAVDVRLIVATHVDLAAAVKEERFRADLYYRISALPIRIPPLRERGAPGVAELAATLHAALRRELGRGPSRISSDALAILTRYPWPGNVRELRNTLERAMLVGAHDAELAPDHLPDHVRAVEGAPDELPADLSLATAERRHILRVLEHVGRNRTHAAKLLCVSRQTLYNRLAELGIE